MKYCKKCGAQLNDNAEFCKKCGTKCNTSTEEARIEAPQSAPKESSGTSSKSSTGLVIGIIIAAIAIGAGVYFYISSSNKTGYSADTYDSYDVVTNEDTYEAPVSAPTVQETQPQTEPATIAETQVTIETEYYEDEIDDAHYDTSEYMINGSDSWYIAEGDLIGFGPWECKVARNEIYARHGRLFKDNQLQQYFNSKSWYYGYIEPDYFDENVLSEVEKANIVTIKNYEKSMGW